MRSPSRWCLAGLGLLCAGLSSPGAEAPPPNIVYILADDLGYGDVRCLNPEGKIATPALDRLAAEGMIFTDAHGSSSVCTPTRYSLLTGRYNWRTRLQAGVIKGYDQPLIRRGTLTVPELLRQHGYHTACIGKWHLGLELARGEKAAAPVAWERPIAEGPVARGFDYFFGISASLDMPPFAFIENDRWVTPPTVEKTWVRKGAAAADFEAVDVVPALARKAVEYLMQRAQAGSPFFLYFPLTSPHTPLVPTPEWKGRSGLGDYGDFVMETDWAAGEVLTALQRLGLAQNTLVIFTSDNGCSPMADIPALLRQGHNPSGPFRGHKADIWDGGHRIPFLARWPGHVPAGAKSGQLTCLSDLLATCAELLGAPLPPEAGADSFSLLPALKGERAGSARTALVHHSVDGRFAIRQGPWKLELCPGSGGWSVPRDPAATAQGLPPVQLYDMEHDPGETTNLAAAEPALVEQLTALLKKYVREARSTPGPTLANDAPIDLWKNNLNELKKSAPAKGVEPRAD